jgi:uncharacterized protein YdeI (BOF family)
MPESLDSFVSPRRQAAHEKKISDIGKDDMRVKLVGLVIDKKDNVVVIDDGTGKINVVFEEPAQTDANKRVRVFGRVMPTEDGFEIQGEILQDMSNADMELYKKVSDIEKE